MSVSHLRLAALLSAAVSTTALAQDGPIHSRTPNEFERRSSGSIAFIQSRPTGTFSNNIGFGYGALGTFMFRLDRAGALSLRGDAGILGYGSEHYDVPLSSTIGGRIRVRVNTNNYIVPLAIGPQLQWPRGTFQPYVNAGIGGQFFYTQSSVRGTSNDETFATTTNQSDWTSAWIAGGGVYVPIYRKEATVSLDLGVQYYNGGRAQYLRPGSIEDLPDSQIRVTPLESDTHMLLVRLGIRVGL